MAKKPTVSALSHRINGLSRQQLKQFAHTIVRLTFEDTNAKDKAILNPKKELDADHLGYLVEACCDADLAPTVIEPA